MKMKLVVNPDFVKPDEMYILDCEAARLIQGASADPFARKEGPAKIVICHPKDEGRIREGIKLSGAELVE